MPKTPPLSHDTKTTEFGGWEMPVEFDSIRTEHRAVRESVGKFDVSHMGQVTVSGPDAGALCQRLVTGDVGGLAVGEATYGAITDERGVMLDDTVVYRLPAAREESYLFVPNAGHDGEMTDRWTAHREQWGLDATVVNWTDAHAMLAVQGPDAPDLLEAVTDVDLAGLARFEVASGEVAGVEALLARTGYTGEAGFELLCRRDSVQELWDALDCQPCGLGARDTLRLEAGLLLSGQDFHPETNPRTPYEAGIDFAVALETDFVGRDALARPEAQNPDERLTGLVLEDRGIARHGHPVQSTDGKHLGTVTSGTMSPTLGEAIALAYLPAAHADRETTVEVTIRDEPKKAHTTRPPFLT